jgi:hypothetical protein
MDNPLSLQRFVTVNFIHTNGDYFSVDLAKLALFRDAVKSYLQLIGRSMGSHVFRTVREGRLIPVNLNDKISSESRFVKIYVFEYTPRRYPDFFSDIVPRLLDMKYGPDIAPLINVCTLARECPYKSNGYLNWQHDITYRAFIDSKWKFTGSNNELWNRRGWKKDNWLHVHHVAAVSLKKTKKLSFFKEHRVTQFVCDHSGMDGLKDETDPLKLILCQCKRTVQCNLCMESLEDNGLIFTCYICHSKLCEDCDKYFCDAGTSTDCILEICGNCRSKHNPPFLDCECHMFCCPPCLKEEKVETFNCLNCKEYKCSLHEDMKCRRCGEGVCCACFSEELSRCYCHGILCRTCLMLEDTQCVRCRKLCSHEITSTSPLKCSFPDCSEAMCASCVEYGYNIRSLAAEGWNVSKSGDPLCGAHYEGKKSYYVDCFEGEQTRRMKKMFD